MAQPLRAANEEVVSDRKRSEALNRHFAAVSKSLEETPMSMALDGIRRQKERRKLALGEVETNTFEAVFTHGELAHAIRKSKLRKAPGPDRISNILLRNLVASEKETCLN